MVLKKDKQKVLGETFDDERIRSFLNTQPPSGESSSFHLLEKAYRGMNEDNFATFVQFYVDAGNDINATNRDGQSFLSIVRRHRNAGPYIDSLIKHGAQ